MSNVATVRKEVQILRRTLAPKEEPEWMGRAREIEKCLIERERVLEQLRSSGLSLEDQAKLVREAENQVLENLKKQGYWGKQE